MYISTSRRDRLLSCSRWYYLCSKLYGASESKAHKLTPVSHVRESDVVTDTRRQTRLVGKGDQGSTSSQLLLCENPDYSKITCPWTGFPFGLETYQEEVRNFGGPN